MSSMTKNKIKVILYSQGEHCSGDRYKEMITELVPEENVETYGTISDLSSRLHMPQRECNIAVLLAADKKDLERILAIRSLLDNIRIILVLPDREPDSIKTGHSLHPRYLSFKDSPIDDVKSVLARMLEVENANKTSLPRRITG
jgi:hypothetical protein